MRKARAKVQGGETAHLSKDCEGVGVDVAIERVQGSRGIGDGVDLGVTMMEAAVIMAVVGAVLVCSSAEFGAVGVGKPWRKILWSPALA